MVQTPLYTCHDKSTKYLTFSFIGIHWDSLDWCSMTLLLLEERSLIKVFEKSVIDCPGKPKLIMNEET